MKIYSVQYASFDGEVLFQHTDLTTSIEVAKNIQMKNIESIAFDNDLKLENSDYSEHFEWNDGNQYYITDIYEKEVE